MPGMGTSHSVEEIVKSNAPGAVVIFSGVADEIFVRNAIANGARGFIPKTFPLKSLSNTLKLIASEMQEELEPFTTLYSIRR